MPFLTITVITSVLIWISLVLVLYVNRIRLRKNIFNDNTSSNNGMLISFFHPYCNSGGGGERVLWTAISAILQHYSNAVQIFIYTNDLECLSTPTRVFRNIQTTFGIDIEKFNALSKIQFVPLMSEPLLRPTTFPHFTLVGQAVGSVVAAFEAVLRAPCDVFLDTTGFPFTLPVFAWLLGSVNGAYIHFPTISADMERRVRQQNNYSITSTDNLAYGITYNNSEMIRKSKFLTSAKVFYYRLLKVGYGWTGNSFNCKLAAVNSSWTKGHISEIWKRQPFLLYPPCPVDFNSNVSNQGVQRKPWIISVGQFRPEKNHELQLRSFARFLHHVEIISPTPTKKISDSYRLIIVGGCRNNKDFARVEKLRQLAQQLKISNFVDFLVNIPWSQLCQLYLSSTVNLHTMIDEHFGIGIVEGMAAELITVAHRSGGPLSDIIGPAECSLSQSRIGHSSDLNPVGFLSTSEEDYAAVFAHIFLNMKPEELLAVGEAAHARALKLFSEAAFRKGWLDYFKKIIS